MNILIAEDSPDIRANLTEILQREGFTVYAAEDGETALQLWEKHQPNIICLDIMMPKMDGYQVCRRIREKNESVPILFLSAKSDEIDIVLGLELGANDFIRKPFGQHELMARIRAALRLRATSHSSPETQFTFGPYTILTDELRAVIGDTSIDLSPRETHILQFFASHSNKVISRNMLLDACWGIDYFPESRSLDQQISRLRKKIEPNSEESPIIETVRGAGYRYSAS